ncbi:hypothetical protein HKX48_004620 [Thoreauomyces humboldtii]|nr:hypothetical protein HKX48_004620 [Thoreauomyces humboldtii]
MRLSILAALGIATLSRHDVLGDVVTEQATIVPMIRHPEGRLALRSSLFTSSEDGKLVLRDDVSEEEIAAAAGHAVVDPDAEEVVVSGTRTRGMGGSKHGKRATQIAPACNSYDQAYYTTISIGTPAVFYTVLIDTGSADLWVPSTKCTTCGTRKLYNPLTSSTSGQLGLACTTYYGAGAATGTIMTDVAKIGSLGVTKQVFIAADSNSNVQPAYIDGLIGLGFSTASWANSIVPDSLVTKSALIENLYWGKVITSATFGIWLDRTVSFTASPSATVGGELAIGSTAGNPARYTGAITWLQVPTYTSSYWQVTWTGIAGPNGVNIQPTGRTIYGVVDTGSTLIIVDYSVAATLNALLGGYSTGIRGLWAIDCTSIAASTIQFTITLGGKPFVLTGADLPTRVWSYNANVCYAPFQARATQDVTNQWILGDVFLRKYYQIYDYNVANGWVARIGFALALH